MVRSDLEDMVHQLSENGRDRLSMYLGKVWIVDERPGEVSVEVKVLREMLFLCSYVHEKPQSQVEIGFGEGEQEGKNAHWPPHCHPRILQ